LVSLLLRPEFSLSAPSRVPARHLLVPLKEAGRKQTVPRPQRRTSQKPAADHSFRIHSRGPVTQEGNEVPGCWGGPPSRLPCRPHQDGESDPISGTRWTWHSSVASPLQATGLRLLIAP
jgi:hypothetical protein